MLPKLHCRGTMTAPIVFQRFNPRGGDTKLAAAPLPTGTRALRKQPYLWIKERPRSKRAGT
ncbi:hypothetical protein Y597_5853 [Burkholderia pseudomallei MSHR1000]|nr:hypothetical protein Y597_5853 [Burkholderia pseudomallei MSHR1000]